MVRPSILLRRPAALMITALAATDLAYRLLLRARVRRALGMLPDAGLEQGEG